MNWRWLFIVQLLCVEISLAVNEVDDSDSPERTLQFVDEVKRKLEEGRTSEADKIILVIGNTGSGKSTLVHYVAGDNSQIEAMKNEKKRGSFIIIDHLDKDINKTTSKTESRTLVPEMLAENGNVWYDCPGFADTRNETVEIATTFLIKSVIEHANFIKFVLVVNYDSVDGENNNRDDFDKLLKHTTQLVKNVEQFKKSFSMVVTKVRSFYLEDDEIIRVTEEEVRKATADFLLEHRDFLERKGSSTSKIELIDAILEGSMDVSYPRISAFWRPTKAGRFDRIENMITGRRTIRQSILNTSSYAVVDKNSFGYPLSGEAQMKAVRLTHHTGLSIFKTLETIGHTFLNGVRDQIDATRDLKSRYELIQLASPYTKVIQGRREIPLDEAKTTLRSLIGVYNLTSVEVEQNFAKIKRYEEILDTFFLIIRNDVQNKNYLLPLMEAVEFFAKYEIDTQNDILNETRQIISVASKLLTKITVRLTNEIENSIELAFDFKEKLDLIYLGKTLMAKESFKGTPVELFIQKVQSLIENFDLTSVEVEETKRMQDYESNLHTLRALVMTFEPESELISKNIPYSSHLQQIMDFFNAKEHTTMEVIKTEAQNYINRITSILLRADAELHKILQKRLSLTAGYRNRLELIELANDVVRRSVTTLQQRATQLITLSQTYNATAVDLNELANVQTFEKNVNALNALETSETKTELRPDELLAKSTKAINYLTHENDWYSFLDQVYNVLSTYQVQKNTQAYIRTTLASWKNSKNNNINVTEASFEDFTKAVRVPFKFPLNDGFRLNELDDILNAMLNSPTKYECNEKSNSMTIRAHFLMTSNINFEGCKLKSRQKITIYVADTLFIDSDLDLRDEPETQLHIFAHTWHVQSYGTAKYAFNLNGTDGANQAPPTSNGVAGKAGQSGTNAGHFFGVANRLIDGESLTVLLNGGNGGNGQDGTGNDDVIVTHTPPRFNSYRLDVRLSRDEDYIKKEALEEMRKVTGSYTGEIKQTRPTERSGRKGNQRHMWCEFRLFKAGCCGQTGMGGPGGLGAHAGYFTFINTGANAIQQPTHFAKDGGNATAGIDAKVCKTQGLLLEADVAYQSYLTGKAIWVNKFAGNKDLENKNCPDVIASPTDKAKSVPEPTNLNMLPGIIAYKSFLIENLPSFTYASVAQKSYDAIASNPVVSREYTLSSFAMEANALEMQFNALSKQIDLLPLYDALIDRIKNFSAIHAAKLTDNDREVLALVYSTLFSKTAGIRNGHQSDLIINIEEFLAASIERIKNIEKIDRIKSIRDEKSAYRNETLAKIAEANSLIDSDIQPEFEHIFRSLDAGIQTAITETIKLQNELGDNVAEKEILESQIQQNAGLRKVVGVGKFLSSVLTLVGGFGVSLGPAPQILNAGVEKLEDLAKDPEFKKSEVPKAIQNVWNDLKKKENDTKAGIDEIFAQLRDSIASLNMDHTQFDEKLMDFKKKMWQTDSLDPTKVFDPSELFVLSNHFLEEAEKLFTTKPNHFIRKRQTDNEIQKFDPFNGMTLSVNVLEKSRPNQNYWNRNDSDDDAIEVVTVDYIDYDDNGRVVTVPPPTTEAAVASTSTTETNIDSTTTEATKKDGDEKELETKLKKYFEHAKNGFKVLKSGAELWKLFSKDDEGLAAIRKAIEDDKNHLKAAVQLEVQIYTELWPTIYALHTTISNVTENMGGQSSVSLDVMQYKIRATLRNVQEKFATKLDGLDSPKEITSCLARLNEAMELMIHIYDRIQGYNEQLRFAGHLANLQEANFGRLGAADENVIAMKYNFQANIILSQYFRATDAFKQAVFPYAAYYLGGAYQLLPSLNVTDSSVVISQAVDRVDSLITSIKELKKTVINQNDMLLHTTQFNHLPGSPGPFYTWNDATARSQIEQLFNGSKIYLFADAQQSKRGNAVKFNKIQLKISAHGNDENERLQNALEKFKVTMTHMGESNYRCNRDFYSISSRPLNLSYTFNEVNGNPIDANDAYRKLVGAAPVLSPYTLWEVQLVRGPLDILKAFTQIASIELHGEGQYLDENAEVCNKNLAKYYPLQMD